VRSAVRRRRPKGMRASTAHAPKHAKLQKMCQESEAWDEALRVAPRRGEHEAARAKLSALLAQIESNSYTDYIGTTMAAHDAAEQSMRAHAGRQEACCRSEPWAIPTAQCAGRGPFFFPAEADAEYLCSPDDVQKARTMWVPATTPPTFKVCEPCSRAILRLFRKCCGDRDPLPREGCFDVDVLSGLAGGPLCLGSGSVGTHDGDWGARETEGSQQLCVGGRC